jgi:hypothetical protein
LTQHKKLPSSYHGKFAGQLNPPITWDEVDSTLRQDALSRVPKGLATVGLGMAGIGGTIAALRHLATLRKEQEIREKELAADSGRVRIVRGKQAGLDDTGQFVKDVFQGRYAREPHHFPAYIPALAATGLASGLGGYKLTNMMLSKIRERNRKREIEQARQEYEQALSGGLSGKLSGERCKLAADVDRVISHLTANGRKLSAEDPGQVHRMLGVLAGLYLTATGGAAGYGMMQGMKSHRNSGKVRAAERARLERQLINNKRVPPMIVSPAAETQIPDPLNAAPIA